MRKTAIATIVAGLGIGAAKLIYDHRAATKQVGNASGRRQRSKAYQDLKHPSVFSTRLSHAYKDLPENNQAQVLQVISFIIPKSNEDPNPKLSFQVHADEYKRTLEYLSTRWGYRTKFASKDLHINRNQMKSITCALVKQGLLEHAQSGNNSVRRPYVESQLALLKPYFRNGLVKPKAFTRVLRNSIADEMFA